MSIIIRPYNSADRPHVEAVFESNFGSFFAEDDRTWLGEFLDEQDGPADRRDGPTFVIQSPANADLPAILAFGGYELSEHYNRAVLTFGMVHSRLHRQGLGRVLLLYRLLQLAEHAEPETDYVVVDTTPSVTPVFVRCGFELMASFPRGYRSGLDRDDLCFRLAEDAPEQLRTRLAKATALAERQLVPSGA